MKDDVFYIEHKLTSRTFWEVFTVDWIESIFTISILSFIFGFSKGQSNLAKWSKQWIVKSWF